MFWLVVLDQNFKKLIDFQIQKSVKVYPATITIIIVNFIRPSEFTCKDSISVQCLISKLSGSYVKNGMILSLQCSHIFDYICVQERK